MIALFLATTMPLLVREAQDLGTYRMGRAQGFAGAAFLLYALLLRCLLDEQCRLSFQGTLEDIAELGSDSPDGTVAPADTPNTNPDPVPTPAPSPVPGPVDTDFDDDHGKKIIIFGVDMLDITLHIASAIRAHNKPSTLHRVPPKPRNWWNNVSHVGNPCYRNKNTQLSCDEYPFASTREGGEANNPALKLVPRSQQSIQGGKLSVFYQNCNVIVAVPIHGEFEVQTSMNGPTRYMCPN